MRWLGTGLSPTDAQLRSATKMMRRQSAITLAPWGLAAAVLVPLNIDAGPTGLIVLASAILFGAIATVCTGFLFTIRTLPAAGRARPPHPAGPHRACAPDCF